MEAPQFPHVALILLFAIPLFAFVYFSPRVAPFAGGSDDIRVTGKRQGQSIKLLIPRSGKVLASRDNAVAAPLNSPVRAIEIRALRKNYDGHEVLHDITVNVGYGAITCLLGPNGAGKTTLMRILVGHEAMSAGAASISLAGTETLADRAVGYIPDSSLVYPLLTVREHLRLVEAVYGLGRFSRAREERFLEALGLDEHADVLASKLSKGLKKRLMLACAVRQGARVLILDEPFDGLDPAGQEMLMSLVEQLRDQGRCMLVSTHRLDIAERVADELIVLDHGTLVFSGTPAQFVRIGQAAGRQVSGDQTAFEAAFAAVSNRNESRPRLHEFGGMAP
ncbi:MULTISPECIES: ABC transporter ATP-binding protein [Actinomyces]|uniref:ABC transporter ATP-binding protein n=1 Tax=Actinomyces respiraculi TaxID=2744574 RepID=A0A7T0LMS5_9ACTO|nr:MULTISPECIES: ABC transporter ATP-binding protein [Actinomyces]QPL06223.1 ABC transporter ATP-binding protein [Actinomyces respiraculi]